MLLDEQKVKSDAEKKINFEIVCIDLKHLYCGDIEEKKVLFFNTPLCADLHITFFLLFIRFQRFKHMAAWPDFSSLNCYVSEDFLINVLLLLDEMPFLDSTALHRTWWLRRQPSRCKGLKMKFLHWIDWMPNYFSFFFFKTHNLRGFVKKNLFFRSRQIAACILSVKFSRKISSKKDKLNIDVFRSYKMSNFQVFSIHECFYFFPFSKKWKQHKPYVVCASSSTVLCDCTKQKMQQKREENQ